MRWRSPKIVATIGILLALAVIGISSRVLSLRGDTIEANLTATSAPTAALSQPATSPRSAVSPTPSYLTLGGSPVPTTVPPLNTVEFPTSQAAYPPDWPSELRLPDTFVLLEAQSGTYIDGTTRVWAAKLRYKGTTREAELALLSFWQQRGWATDRLETRSGTTVIGVRRNGEQGTGSYVLSIDPDDPSFVRIIGTVRL